MKNKAAPSDVPPLSHLTINAKIAILLLATTLTALIATGLIYYDRHKTQVLSTLDRHLSAVVAYEARVVDGTVAAAQDQVTLMARRIKSQVASTAARRNDFNGTSNAQADLLTMAENSPLLNSRSLVPMLQDLIEVLPRVEHATILNTNDSIILSTAGDKNRLLSIENKTRLGGVGDTTITLGEVENNTIALFISELIRRDDIPIAKLLVEFSLSDLALLMNRQLGLGYTEEVMLLYKDAKGVVNPVVPFKFSTGAISQASLDRFFQSAVKNFRKDNGNLKSLLDYRERPVYAVSHSFSDENWVLIAKIDVEDALQIMEEDLSVLWVSIVSTSLLVILVSLIFSKSLTRPLTELTRVSQMIASGDYSQRIPWRGGDEVGMLASAFNRMADKLISLNASLDERVTKATHDLATAYQRLEQTNRHLERVTLEDPLTRIANRRAFDRSYFQEWKRAARERVPLSLLMIDVDYFKLYNDTLGHGAGDTCLVRIASVMRTALQREGDLVARYGGEEFVMLLPNTSESGCRALIERVQKALQEEHILHPSSPIERLVTLSFGYGTIKPGASAFDAQSFLEQVDKALYGAKRAGRNTARGTTLASTPGDAPEMDSASAPNGKGRTETAEPELKTASIQPLRAKKYKPQ